MDGIEDLLRQLAPQVLGALLRRHQALDLCEDAVQEALIAAATDWPAKGVPDNPRAWLITVATRRLIDEVRSESARRQREDRLLFGAPPAELSRLPGDEHDPDRDDTLVLLLLCCHPALTPPSQIALTLKAVGGLTTAEIARAFFVPETTMAQRVSRAKQRIREAGAAFSLPPAEEARRSAPGGAARALPDLQRGLHDLLGHRDQPHRPDQRSDPAHPRAAPSAPPTARSRACWP